MFRRSSAKARMATVRPHFSNARLQHRLRRVISIIGASALTLGTFGFVLGASQTAGANPVTTVWVNHSGDAGWSAGQVCYTATYLSIVPTVTSDTVTFRTGPGTTPDGEGSVQVATGNGTTGGTCNSAIRSSSYAGVKLATLTSLSYWSYSSVNNGQQFPFLELNVNYGEGGTTADDTVFFEPPYQTPTTGSASCPNQGATAMTTWQDWTALHGCWWSNSGNFGNPGTGVEPISALLATHPDAYIVNASQSFITATAHVDIPSVHEGGLAVEVGEGGTTTTFQGNAGEVTVGTAASTTQYDFGALPTVTGFTPANGSTVGGTTVTITGTNLTGSTGVKFGSTTAATFRLTGSTKITVTTKSHSEGAVSVSVTTPEGPYAAPGSYTFVKPLPAAPSGVTEVVSSTGNIDAFCGAGLPPLTPYTTIQAAVNAAAANAKIYVCAGTYNEHVTIGEPLTILGAQQGVAVGAGDTSARSDPADEATLDGTVTYQSGATTGTLSGLTLVGTTSNTPVVEAHSVGSAWQFTDDIVDVSNGGFQFDTDGQSSPAHANVSEDRFVQATPNATTGGWYGQAVTFSSVANDVSVANNAFDYLTGPGAAINTTPFGATSGCSSTPSPVFPADQAYYSNALSVTGNTLVQDDSPSHVGTPGQGNEDNFIALFCTTLATISHNTISTTDVGDRDANSGALPGWRRLVDHNLAQHPVGQRSDKRLGHHRQHGLLPGVGGDLDRLEHHLGLPLRDPPSRHTDRLRYRLELGDRLAHRRHPRRLG